MLDQVVTVDATVGSGQTNDGDFVSSLSTSLSSTSLSSTSLSSESLSSASVSLPPDSLPPVSLVSAGVPMAVVPLNGDRRYVGHFRRSIVPLFCGNCSLTPPMPTVVRGGLAWFLSSGFWVGRRRWHRLRGRHGLLVTRGEGLLRNFCTEARWHRWSCW
jgi:hypothetical protein